MYTTPTIRTLQGSETIYVLRDHRGNSMGTGSREALEVLRYIATQVGSREEKMDVWRDALSRRPMAHVRSALVF
jgi:hypothetical protein